jgi:electron transfer flavoprotein alpha subunit
MNGGILVLVEHLKGAVADVSFEVLGAGRKLADALPARLCAVVLGRDAGPLTAALGLADAVLTVEDPALEAPSPEVVAPVLSQLAAQEQAALVLLPGTNMGIGIGASLSAATGLPFVNFCKEVKAQDGQLVITTQLFGGKILADVPLTGASGILCLVAGALPAEAGRSDRAPMVRKVSVRIPPPQVVFKRLLEPAAGDVDITKQDVLVSVGRGIQNQDNIALAEELAGLLNGAVSASRPVVDQGWLPLTRQVGKSGMTVAPKLYLALGISGAPEHWEGMKNAQLIIAVNTDPQAPVFGFAHYGAAVDLFDLLEPLKAAIEARKSAR